MLVSLLQELRSLEAFECNSKNHVHFSPLFDRTKMYVFLLLHSKEYSVSWGLNERRQDIPHTHKISSGRKSCIKQTQLSSKNMWKCECSFSNNRLERGGRKTGNSVEKRSRRGSPYPGIHLWGRSAIRQDLLVKSMSECRFYRGEIDAISSCSSRVFLCERVRVCDRDVRREDDGFIAISYVNLLPALKRIHTFSESGRRTRGMCDCGLFPSWRRRSAAAFELLKPLRRPFPLCSTYLLSLLASILIEICTLTSKFVEFPTCTVCFFWMCSFQS